MLLHRLQVNRSAQSFDDGKADKVNLVERLTDWLLHPTARGASKAPKTPRKSTAAVAAPDADTASSATKGGATAVPASSPSAAPASATATAGNKQGAVWSLCAGCTFHRRCVGCLGNGGGRISSPALAPLIAC